jgi:hypothetical protein
VPRLFNSLLHNDFLKGITQLFNSIYFDRARIAQNFYFPVTSTVVEGIAWVCFTTTISCYLPFSFFSVA